MEIDEEDLRSLSDELLSAMASVRRNSRRASLRPEELSSLTGAQLELVRLVRRRPGVSVAQAASELRLAPNTVSTLVRQLCDGQVLTRSVDGDDRRVAHLELCADIRRKVDAWRDRRVEALALAIGRLSPRDERRLEEATGVLQRLAEHLESPKDPLERTMPTVRRNVAGDRRVGTRT